VHLELTGSFRFSLRQQCPPAELLAATDASFDFPPPPAWALAATAPAILGDQTSFPCASKQLSIPFSDDDSDDGSQWERLSSTEEDVDTCDGPGAEQQTLFYDSYPLATRAAGLTVVSTCAISTQGGSTALRRLAWFFFWAAIVAALATIVNGPIDVKTEVPTLKAVAAIHNRRPPTKVSKPTARPSKMQVSYGRPSMVVRAPRESPVPSSPPKSGAVPFLVPSSSRENLSFMVRRDEAAQTQPSNDSTNSTPASEQLLQKFLTDGVVRSMGLAPYVESCFDCLREAVSPPKPTSAVVPEGNTFKPLQAIVKQASKVWGNVRRGVKRVRMFVTWGVISVMHLSNPATHIGK
jgi:hypothetical protein